MTYLQLVNAVMVRLREDTVSAVAINNYSQLIGALVNDAKRMVEQAWDWSALRRDITVTTDATNSSYALTTAGDAPKVLTVTNDTQKCFVEPVGQDWMTKQYLDPQSGVPTRYAFDGLDASADSKIKLYPKPDGVYSITAKVVVQQAELAVDEDVLLVPSLPVRSLALAYAARERGEVGGSTAAEYFAMAEKDLSDAIAYDAAKHQGETVFRYV